MYTLFFFKSIKMVDIIKILLICFLIFKIGIIESFITCSCISEFTVRILDNDQEDSDVVDHDNKEAMNDSETEEYYRSQDKVIEKLRELVQVVEICLESNPGMQSTDLTRTSKHLLTTYESE